MSGVERLLDAAKHARLENLRAILACTYTFDGSYFEQVLDALREDRADGSEILRGIPIDVVCDHRHYRGHSSGYNVYCWGESNLFHAKLLMLCFADRIVWLEGSLNLTRAGHGLNRELASYHESERGALPAGVFTLLQRLGRQGVPAAMMIGGSARRRRTATRNRSSTSLDAPLLDGLLDRVKRATQVVLVAPFFDQREQGEPTIDTTALRRLAQQYANTPFRIYLPQLVGPKGDDALQGHRAVFANAFGPKANAERVAFCGVPSDHRPLHAKLIAIQHGARNSDATLLTGSPNITESALMRKGTSGNVELARELQVRWRHVDALLQALGHKFKPLSECHFVPPPPIQMFGWHALQSAQYDPLRGELDLNWLKPKAETIVRYAGEPLIVPATRPIAGFTIRGDDLRLETICRANPSRRSWCPIVIPIEARIALADLPESEAPPEWWIAQLGALSGLSTRRQGFTGLSTPIASISPTKFPLAHRVRDLAERMRYSVDIVTSPDAPKSRILGVLNLLEKIFDVHDVVTATTVVDQAWRLWVRLEVIQAVAAARSGRQPGSPTTSRLLRDLKGRLASMTVPLDAEVAWRVLTEKMR
jgi:hypothetical protein